MFSLIEKYNNSPSTSLPLSTINIASLTSISFKFSIFPKPPKIIFPIIGSSSFVEPTIGITVYGFSSTSNVATKLEVRLLYVAPTVTDPKFLPGLPIVLSPGPSFPAAVTTKIPSSNAILTARSILAFVLFTPKLILIMSAPSSIAFSIALMINSDDTPSPSSDTL